MVKVNLSEFPEAPLEMQKWILGIVHQELEILEEVVFVRKQQIRNHGGFRTAGRSLYGDFNNWCSCSWLCLLDDLEKLRMSDIFVFAFSFRLELSHIGP